MGLVLFLSVSFAEEDGAVRTGAFMGVGGHDAEGNVSVGKDPRGKALLTMTDITGDSVPDGRVSLADGLNFLRWGRTGHAHQIFGNGNSSGALNRGSCQI